MSFCFMAAFKGTLKFYTHIYENIFTKCYVKLQFVCVATQNIDDKVTFLDSAFT